MVSTRGIKLKFFVGEKVLCYEPDPTKAKVLYDSKVLDIVIRKDQRGRKTVDYLIHFQGWNSSWDRCVCEEYVLKDTTENRQLQRDLAEKSQLQLGAYLYRKERKKHIRKSTDPIGVLSEDGSSGSPIRIDTDENPDEMSSSSDENSSFEDDAIFIELTPELREILESDYYLINKKNKLMKLPAEPNVVTILETYYKHYATNQICGLTEKNNSRYRTSLNNTKAKPEDIERNLTICTEVMDGLRVYFDYTLNDLLLYSVEKNQIVTKMAVMPNPENDKSQLKMEDSNINDNHTTIQVGDYFHQNGHEDNATTARRRTLRSSKCDSTLHTNGSGFSDENSGPNSSKPGSSVGSSNSDITGPMAKALEWRLLPDHVYQQQPQPPCLVYGAIHFLRLFVKMPEILMASSIPEVKLKILLRHIDSIIDFLNEHKEWFGEKYYIDRL